MTWPRSRWTQTHWCDLQTIAAYRQIALYLRRLLWVEYPFLQQQVKYVRYLWLWPFDDWRLYGRVSVVSAVEKINKSDYLRINIFYLVFISINDLLTSMKYITVVWLSADRNTSIFSRYPNSSTDLWRISRSIFSIFLSNLTHRKPTENLFAKCLASRTE